MSIQSFSTGQITFKNLIKFKVGKEDDKWAVKALQSLEKKLKSKDGALIDLYEALINRTVHSKCVTFPRSIDGRVQVSYKKALPHVMYCKIWRWPDLQGNHELEQGSTFCEHSYYSKSKDVCINPYHYNRVQCPAVPTTSSSTYIGEYLPDRMPLSPINGQIYPQGLSYSNTFHQPFMDSSQSKYPNYPGAHLNDINNTVSFSQSSNMDTSVILANNLSSGSLQSSCLYANCFASPQTQMASHDQNYCMTSPEVSRRNDIPSEHKSFSFWEQKNWCSILYWEMKTHVGETFHGSLSSIVVDGFTDPSNNGNRFSIGKFNDVKRDCTITSTRMHIGKGLHLLYDGEQVIVEVLSQNSIFVQSGISNILQGCHSETVCKVQPGQKLTIFNSRCFLHLLQQVKTYEDANNLKKMCMIRISFVKGWGKDYQRKEVTSVPCWIEVQLNNPLGWLDRVLYDLGTPVDKISSVS